MLRSEFYIAAEIFFKELRRDFQESKFELDPSWDIDHVCYRTASLNEYERLKMDFLDWSVLLIESEVGGRMIATYELREPLFFMDRKIELVELPAPKSGKTVESGFEHIEVVAPVSFEELEERYSRFTLDRKGLGKEFNAELEIVLGKRNVKFHHLSLESVILLEKDEKVMGALVKSGLLRELRDLNPLVVGWMEGRGVSVVMEVWDVEMVVGKLRGLSAGHVEVAGGVVSCVVEVDGVRIEILGRGVRSVEQEEYRGFLERCRNLKNFRTF